MQSIHISSVCSQARTTLCVTCRVGIGGDAAKWDHNSTGGQCTFTSKLIDLKRMGDCTRIHRASVLGRLEGKDSYQLIANMIERYAWIMKSMMYALVMTITSSCSQIGLLLHAICCFIAIASASMALITDS